VCHDLDPGAIVVALPEPLALAFVRLEADGATAAAELFPRVGETPSTADVGDDDSLVEESAERGGNL
jgi:hypothetical protein